MDSERLKKTISAAQEEFTRLLEQRGFAELKAYEIHLSHIVEGSAKLPPPDRSLMPKLLYGDSLPEILADHVGEPAELLEALADEAEEIYRGSWGASSCSSADALVDESGPGDPWMGSP